MVFGEGLGVGIATAGVAHDDVGVGVGSVTWGSAMGLRMNGRDEAELAGASVV